jgi:menaquinone-dependent protoporphyrinogen oxidase
MKTTNPRRVLVTYASKHGATASMAERIGHALKQAGLTVNTTSLGTHPNPTAYDAVVMGSAVYMGQWRPEAAHFLADHASVLAERPVWLFSSGPTGEGKAVELLKGWRYPARLGPLVEKIQPQDTAVFRGALAPADLGLRERLITWLVKAPVGDFRDWAAVDKWGARIGQDLLMTTPSSLEASKALLS